MSRRPPRWTWFLVSSVLLGAFVFMHGFDGHTVDSAMSRSAPAAPATAEHAVEHSHGDPASTEHGGCPDCLAGHVMVACVAILSSVVAFGFLRRLLARVGFVADGKPAPERVRRIVEMARPPDPAWVRLSVMRC
jgi:hypothetical protein